MKKKKITPESKIKKLKLDKMVVADFDTKKVKGGHPRVNNNNGGG